MEFKRPRTAFFLLFLFFFVVTGFLFAQTDNASITLGSYRKIHSKVLDEDRTLLIHLPADYAKSDQKFPVLYKLDGEEGTFLQAASATNYLFDWMDKVPDHIVVGIENTDRNRDMGLDQKPDNFMQFIRTELIPFIDNNYRASRFRVLSGQSASSGFALYFFLKQPELFDAYILSSFGMGRPAAVSLFEGELKKSTKLRTVGRKYLFIADGKQDTYDPDGSRTKRGEQLLESLKQVVPATVLMNGAREIHDAAAAGDLTKVRALLEADPTLLESKDDRPQVYGSTPLMSACWGPGTTNQQATVANYLIDKGANINV